MANDRLDQFAEKISSHLARVEKARDESYILHREIIKKSGMTIRAVHRGEKERALTLLSETREKILRSKALIEVISELTRSGFIHDAQKEYVEASVTTAIVFGDEIPDPDNLKVNYAAYLNGIAEVIGELRREILDLMRRDQTEKCEYFLQAMDDIYSVLVTMDFSDAVTGGLRRTTDQSRAILERTRGDFTNYLVNKRLRDDLKARIHV
ncbi:MAG: haloacid dehalogenase [Candidatus Eremiobacteraeota bacterium]|nr:haloacid dehalogenase [Candidatus Eremiobacteraeota bacterium]